MATADAVANCLLNLALTEDPEPDPLTPMRLQKLMYYCQGWWLAINGEQLFNEPIEAWAHGPVVPSLFRRFKEYGNGAIPSSEVGPIRLTSAEREHIAMVWETYKPFSATRLRQMTHDERPWMEARENAGAEDGEACRQAISPLTMITHFGRMGTKKPKA